MSDALASLTISENWKKFRLKRIARLNPSKTEVANLPNETEVTFLPMEAVSESWEVDYSRTRLLEEVRSGYTYFRDGDILIAKITPCFENGKGALVDGCINGFGFGTTEFHVIRSPNAETTRFLSYVLRSHRFKVEGAGMMTGTAGQKRLSDDYVKDFEVFLPSLKIQGLIAQFLDRKTTEIDALIAKKKHLIQLLEEKRSALIDLAVTKGLNLHVEMKDSGIAWIGVVPKNWKIMRLRYLTTEKVAGPYGSSLTKSMYSSTGYRVYGQQQVISNDFSIGDYYISTEKFQEMRRYEVHSDDVLITVMGTIGCVAVVPNATEPGIINPRLVRYVVRRSYVLPDFFAWVLRSQVGKKQLSEMAQGVTMDGLNLTVLSNTLMPIPPLEEQEHILAYIQKKNEQHDRIRKLVDQQIFRLQEYRRSLITAAVTGKIDVSEEIAS